MNKMVIMLENNDTRYEFYMQGICRSNVDSTIVRYEMRYNRIHHMNLGSSVSYGQRLYEDFGEFVNKLLLKGFEVVTVSTKKFA